MPGIEGKTFAGLLYFTFTRVRLKSNCVCEYYCGSVVYTYYRGWSRVPPPPPQAALPNTEYYA